MLFLALGRMASLRRAFNIQTFSVLMPPELIIVAHIKHDSTVLAFQLEHLDTLASILLYHLVGGHCSLTTRRKLVLPDSYSLIIRL
jgi:uncharacterized membrane protein YoaT (DUF817 family)